MKRSRAFVSSQVSSWIGSLPISRTASSAGNGSQSNPFSSPTEAKANGATNGTVYYFKDSTMPAAVQATYSSISNDSSLGYINVFSAPSGSTATVNLISSSIPFKRFYVQRSTGDLWAYVVFASTQTYAATSGITGSSGANNLGVTAGTKVILGSAGGHGIYNTGQSACNWGSATGAIGAGYDGTCGSYPNGLKLGTGMNDPYQANMSGTYEFWVNW
jgi:hypothetical protein